MLFVSFCLSPSLESADNQSTRLIQPYPSRSSHTSLPRPFLAHSPSPSPSCQFLNTSYPHVHSLLIFKTFLVPFNPTYPYHYPRPRPPPHHQPFPPSAPSSDTSHPTWQ